MSYNIRYDNPDDGDHAWSKRRGLAIQTLLKEMPDVIGIQEALQHQREQLCEGLRNYYEYFGRARDLGSGEECGIFYLRHRFKIINNGLTWFNETRTPGKVGFGARLPRNMTFLTMRDTINNTNIIVVNTHFDHESSLSQL